MKQLFTIAFSLLVLTRFSFAQSGSECTGFSATYSSKESRCASTGSITITPSGGSGNFSYKVISPISLPITSTSVITGLAPGNYTVQTKDMETGCVLIKENIVVGGSYSDPRFTLDKTDLNCIGSVDGTISVSGLENGRSPFTYKIISPSPAGVGISNTTGMFSALPAGDYYIQLLDSCGGIQTRTVAIQDYNWSITSNLVSKVNCNTVSISLTLTDNKGNTNQSGSAFSGFKYGVVNAPGDTTWNTSSSFNYTQTPLRKIIVVVKDRCGAVKSATWQNDAPSLSATVTVTNTVCNTFDVKVTSPQNFSLGSMAYLKQGSTIVQTNTTGEFTNIPYGSYCIEVKDNCYDTTITRCFIQKKPTPSVNANVDIFNVLPCVFDVKISGQTNLFNPTYKLYNSSNLLIATNTTGTFTSLSYDKYCMQIISSNPCYDTTISRCFNVVKPKPTVPVPIYSNETCSSYTAAISGATSLVNPTYCLYQNNALVSCSPGASFPNLAYGVQYCIKITSSSPCYDTTITHCFTRSKPAPAAANPTILNKSCSTFSVKIASVNYIPDPKYCLYNAADNQIACNSTGQFDNVPYGNNYYITVITTSTTTDCSVALVKKSFSVARTIPTVNATVTTSNKTCTTFSATLGSSNMTSPKFELYNNSGTSISTNTTGIFSNLAYGSYRIVATTNCLDTFVRTFTEAPTLTSFTATAAESCTIGSTDIKVSFTAGQAPFLVKVLNPLNTVVASQTVNSATGNYTFAALTALPAGMSYRIAVSSACAKNDTLAVTPKTSLFNRTKTVASRCPSASAGNGSGDISIELNSNLGLYAPKIVRKNGSLVSITPTVTTPVNANNSKYKFLELTPATYVVEYNITTCSKTLYDTITVAPYAFPNLKNSAAYQCDNNNFSVSAVSSGGVAPFSYEIIGSNPAGIDPVTQTSGVFDILSSNAYSLVRMRAIDGCGNGTLNDVSVLPLGQLTIRVDNVDCYSNNLTLSVDTVPNATYTWYLKKKMTSTDSALVTTNQNYNIPYLLPTDTGVYVCKTSVNNGCLQRISYFNLKGDCSILLPVRITSFNGKLSGNDVALTWTVAEEESIKEYQVERSIGSAAFEYIGSLPATNDERRNQYSFIDRNAPGGRLRYRLKIISKNSGHSYSKTVELSHNAVFITAAPNPVKQDLSVSISAKTDASYNIRLFNLNGQIIYQQTTNRIRSGVFRIQRTVSMPAGFYLIKVLNTDSGEEFTQKLIFE